MATSQQDLEALGFTFEQEEEEQETPEPPSETPADTSIEAELRNLGFSFDDDATEEVAQEAPAVEAETEALLAKPAEEGPKTVPTTIEGLYYAGPEGSARRAREQELYTKRMGAGGTGEFTQVEGGLTPQEQAELDQIYAEKEAIYENIEGPNVTDLGPIGKFVTDEEGETTYVPGPGSTEAGTVYRKFLSDSLRGLLGLPELAGIEGFQDIVPKVNTEDEAVAVLSEVAQFSTGAFGGYKIAQKLPKIEEAMERMPALRAFAEMTPDSLKSLAKFTRQGAVMVGEKAVPAGTISSGVGALALADEDVSTFFGGEDMTMAEAKLRVLQDSLTIGLGLSAIGAGPAIVTGIPLVKTAVGAASDAMSILFAGQSKVDQTIAQRIGEATADTLEELRNAKTPEEALAAREKLYEKVNQAWMDKTGMSLDEVVNRIARGDLPADTYQQISGEALGNDYLIKIYNGLLLKRGQKSADQALSEALGKNQQARIDAIKAQARKAREQLAPEGRATAEKVREEVAVPAVQREEELVEQMERAQRAETIGRMEAEAAETVAQPAAAQATELATAQQVQTALENSPVARSNVNKLNNLIDEDGTVQPIDDVLAADLETARTLGQQLDEAYTAVPVAGDEALSLVDNLIASMDRSLLTSPEQIERASGPLRRMLAKFADEGDDVVKEQANTALQALNNAQTDEQFFAAVRNFNTNVQQQGSELPTLTAKDLLDVKRSVTSRARDLKRQSGVRGTPNASELNELGTALEDIGKRLDARITALTEGNTTAQQARKTFDDFYRDEFSQRWKSKTGSEWKGDLIGANTTTDMQDAVDKVAKMVANPNMGPADFTQVKEIVEQMEPAVRSEFAKGLQNHVIKQFSPDGISFDPDALKTVGQAEKLLRELDRYLTGTTRYQELLPEATAPLVALRNQLDEVLQPARQAQEAATTAAQRAKVEEKLLTARQQEALYQISSARRQADKVINESAVKKLTGYEGEPAEYFIGLLGNKKTGPKQLNELWTRAGMIGEKGADGLTGAQKSVQESLIEALLRKSYTPVEEGADSARIAPRVLEEMMDPNSAIGKMVNKVYANDPNGKKLLTMLTEQARSFRRSQGAGFTAQSATAEKQAFENQILDLQTVIFGPLTERARLARFFTKIGMNASGLDNKLVNAYVKVLTRPEYTKMIIDYAVEAKRKGLMPEEKAVSDMMARLLLAQQGYKEFLDSTRGEDGSLIFRIEDPVQNLINRAESQVVVEQMDEMLSEEATKSPDQSAQQEPLTPE